MIENALIYRRVSTEEQAADGTHSLNTQLHLCTKAIEDGKKYKLASDGVYTDAGKSATTMNRPSLQDMLARIMEDKSIKAVFVQDTDRLARNANDHLTIKALLRKHQVVLISVSQPGMEDSPEGNFLDLIIAGVNQLSSQITGRKTKKSMEERFWGGWFPTRAPMGYLNTLDPSNPKKRIVTIDPVRGPLIKEMLTLYSTGNYSLLEVRDLFFRKGLVNRSAGRFSRSQMACLVENPFHYGEMRWKELVNKGNHEPLITKEIFEKCNRVKSEHNNGRCRKRKFNFLLRGFLYCFSCGRRWTAEKQLKKNKSYYRCNANVQPTDVRCKEHYVETADLEKQVEDKFFAVEFSDEFREKIENKIRALYQEKKNSITDEQQSLQSRKNALLKKLETAEDKLLSGTLSDSDFSRIKAKLLPQIENIEGEMQKLDRARTIKIDVIQKILKLTRNVGETYKDASPELKRLYIGLFWAKFEVSKGVIVRSTPSEIIDILVGLGHLKIKGNPKATPIKSMFAQKSAYLKEGIKITTERGG